MSTAAGDPYQYPYQYPYWQHPHYPVMPTYGTGVTTWNPPLTEDRIREIIREELREALKELKP